MTTDELLTEVLRLPRDQRARVVEEVLSSLEDADDEVALAWADELARRSGELRMNRIQAEDWNLVREQILKDLSRSGADRSSS